MNKYGRAVTIGMYGLGQSLVCQNTLACTVVNYLVDFMNTPHTYMYSGQLPGWFRPHIWRDTWPVLGVPAHSYLYSGQLPGWFHKHVWRDSWAVLPHTYMYSGQLPGWFRPHIWRDTWPAPEAPSCTALLPRSALRHSGGKASAPGVVHHRGTSPWCEPHTCCTLTANTQIKWNTVGWSFPLSTSDDLMLLTGHQNLITSYSSLHAPWTERLCTLEHEET